MPLMTSISLRLPRLQTRLAAASVDYLNSEMGLGSAFLESARVWTGFSFDQSLNLRTNSLSILPYSHSIVEF
jgi:hypothetical protein